MYNILKIKKNRFNYQELMECLGLNSYEQLENAVHELCQSNKITPIKKSGKTSFRPFVYQEYKKVVLKEHFEEYKKEISALEPTLNISKYLSQSQKFVEYREQIIALSDFMWRRKDKLKQQMSVKEKSFAIWGNEKFLESKAGQQICLYNNLDEQTLNYYYAPEPFFCVELDRISENKTVLIIENKDTWYSISKALRYSIDNVFSDVKIDLLIYGEGNKATRKNAITDFLKDYSNKVFEIYYVGDIDVEGVNLLYRIKKANSSIAINPFLPLYVKMALGANPKEMNKTDDNRGREYTKEFLDFFEDPIKNVIAQVLEENRRIPQEILNLQDYIKMCR